MHPDDHQWLSVHLHFDGNLYFEVADRVILDVVAPLATGCQQQGLVKRWFFLRFSEEGSHIRLRLFGRPEILERDVEPRISEAIRRDAEGNARVTRLEHVPYEPEVERYGGPHGVVLAEQLFHHSSETAVALLAKIDAGERSSRLGKAMLAMLVLLHSFESSRPRAGEIADVYGRNYLRALVPDPEQQRHWLTSFEQGFERQADRLAEYVEVAWQALATDDELTPELDLYRQRMREIAGELRTLCDRGLLSGGGETLADWPVCVRRIVPSYLHMMNNRLGVSIQEESYLSVLIHLTLSPPAISTVGPNTDSESAKGTASVDEGTPC